MLLLTSVVGLVLGVVWPVAWVATTVLGLVPATGWVVASLRHGRLGADIVAVLALVGTLATGEYLAGALISLMLATGRVIEEWAELRARRELTALVRRVPSRAHRYGADGAVDSCPLDEVAVGDRILVRSGEVVPVDGVVLTPAVLDESALTGEPLPVERPPGDLVRSGVVVSGPPCDVQVTSAAEDSTYAGIVRLVEGAQADTAPFVRMADRYAAWFVPLALAVSGAAWWWSGDPVRAVAVLVVATPCPLILAAPVAMVAGMAQSARHGAVVKGGSALERLAQARVVLLDKTGTLTEGRPVLAQVTGALGTDSDELLRLAASLEQASPHVAAAAIVVAARARGLRLSVPTDVVEHHGFGVEGEVDGHRVAVGKLDWLSAGERPDWLRRARRRSELDGALLVLVAVDGQPEGALVLEDRIRSDAPRMVRALRMAGVDRVVLVTGDRAEVAEAVGHALGIDEVFADRLPDEKLQIVRAETGRGGTAFVGDGINDAPALAAADVGVALGVRGATASSEAADVVLMVDRIDRLAEAMLTARRAATIAWQSVVVGMGLSLAAMVAAAAGLLPPAWGAVLQEVIDVVAILNALRAARPVARPRVRGADAELGHRLYEEHRALAPQLVRVRDVADGLDVDGAAVDLGPAHELYAWLRDDLLPHETAEEEELYPVMARALGGSDPVGAMSRAHVEIGHLVRRVGRLLTDLVEEESLPEDVVELRRVLYGLHAVLLLHFAQEEEGLFPLLDPRAEQATGSPTAMPG